MTAGPVRLIETRRHDDVRGWFRETYEATRYLGLGIDCEFLQDNQSYSASAGTVRGLHLQRPPHAQAKLVQCVRGRIADYALDLRRGSPTYGRHVTAELSAENGRQLFIPVGFGHAFVTLEPDCEVLYKCSAAYAPDHEDGVRWTDPALEIPWPLPGLEAVLSDRDRTLPDLAAFDSPFVYDGTPLTPLYG